MSVFFCIIVSGGEDEYNLQVIPFNPKYFVLFLEYGVYQRGARITVESGDMTYFGVVWGGSLFKTFSFRLQLLVYKIYEFVYAHIIVCPLFHKNTSFINIVRRQVGIISRSYKSARLLSVVSLHHICTLFYTLILRMILCLLVYCIAYWS